MKAARTADYNEQKAAHGKCEIEQRQLRNDRNKEISGANQENWDQFRQMGGVAAQIRGMMQEFTEIKLDVANVDVIKTAFRACPAPLTQEDQVKSERCREMLKALTGGDDETKYGPIFKELANKN